MPLNKRMAISHLDKARHNFELYIRLKEEGAYLDWAVTVLFYTAMHLAQACIVERVATGFDIPRNHSDRDAAVARELPAVYMDYSFLYTRSQWARYHVDRLTPTNEQVQELEDSSFRSIVDAMAALDIKLEP
jgi:hypothetical protein